VHASILTEAPEPTLTDAARAADQIAVGEVTDVDFKVEGVSVVSFHISRRIGPASGKALTGPDEITILQAGGPEPADADWHGMVLSEAEADPLLLPGDRALLFLRADGSRYYVAVGPPPATI